MTIGKINITDALKNAEAMLRDDKTASPQMRTMMELLIVVIRLLVGKLGINGKNSSKPPSQDSKRARGSKQKTTGTKRKPGGQNGHKGSTLKKVPNPDRVETLEIHRRTLPRANYTPVGFETRQVIDIQITSEVTEYRAEILEDDAGNQWRPKLVAFYAEGKVRSGNWPQDGAIERAEKDTDQLIPQGTETPGHHFVRAIPNRFR